MSERNYARELVEAGVVSTDPSDITWQGTAWRSPGGMRWNMDSTPSLSDPATCGVLLGMLRERHGNAPAIEPNCGFTVVMVGGECFEAPTLGEALAAALLAEREEPGSDPR